jgi:hypothetical protein
MRIILIGLITLLSLGCTKKPENKILASSSNNIWKYHNTLTKSKGSKIYELTKTTKRNYLVTNVDTDFIKINLFKIDYNYWVNNSRVPLKYIYFHVIDTLYKVSNKCIITFFEAYNDRYYERFYIKLCKIEDGLILSTYTLASQNAYGGNNTVTSSVILSGNLIISREITEEYGSSDDFYCDTIPYECNDLTQFTLFDINTFSFRPLLKTQNKYYNCEVQKYLSKHPGPEF